MLCSSKNIFFPTSVVTSLLTSGIKEWIWEIKLDLKKEGQECELKIIIRNTSSSVKPLGFEHVTFLCQYCQPQMTQWALTLPLKDWSHNIWVGVFGGSPCSHLLYRPPSVRWLVHCQRCNSYLAVNNKRDYNPTPTFSRHQAHLGVTM